MSANCTLTPEAREDLVVLVAKNMMDMADAAANLNIKNYMTEMYNKLEPALGEVDALVYASYVPKVLTEVIPFDSRILNLVLDSEVNMNELYSLSKRLSDPTTVLELTKKELQLKDVKKKKVKRLNKASKSKKKASTQFELDFENGAYVYKRGTKVKILRGNNKGEIWTVVADEALINGSNRVTLKSPDGKTNKNFSKKSIEFNEGVTPELSATALTLQNLRKDLEYEEKSPYRNEEVINVLKDGIAELEYMLANNSKKPLTPQEKQKGKKPVSKKRTSNDDLLEMRHHERREGIDSWTSRTRAERDEEELRVSKSGSPQTEAEETEATYTKEELDGMAQELMQLQAEIEEARWRFSEEVRDTIPHAVVIDNWEKITPASAKKETGTKVGTRSDIHISLLSKEGKSVERAAESMWADHGERLGLDDTDFRALIIDVLMAGTLKNANETLIGAEDKDNSYKLERIAEIEAILDRFISSDPNTNQPKQDNKGAVPIAPITGTKQKAVKPNVIPINKVEPQVRINAVAESKGVFQANAPSVLVTTGREAEYKDRSSEDYRVPYDKTQLMYKIQRNILAKIGKSKNNRGSDITLGKYRDGVYLTVMHKNNPALDSDLATLDYDADRLGVFLVVTDKTGTPLRFNSATGGVANEGEQAIYPMHPTKNIIGADGETVLSSKELRTAAQALAVARGDKNNVAQYEAQIISEAKELHKLKMHALQNQNDSSRILQISGGSMGFIQQSNFDRTLLKGNVDTRDLTLSLDKGVGVIGYTSGSVDELHGSKLQLEKPTVKQSGVAETIKSLLFDDLVDIDGNQISYEERRNMLRLYLPVNTEFIQLWRNKDEVSNESLDDGVFGEYNLEIGTVDNNLSFGVDFSNPAEIEKGKQLFDRLVNEVREKDKNKKYNTQYNQFKLHVSRDDINRDTVSMPVINGNVVKTEKVKYMDLVVNNNFQVNTKEIGADKKLRRTNSYFQFSINPADFIEETIKEAEPTQQTSKVEVVSRYTNADVKANPNKIYVFGDNNKRTGTGGQAQIRNNENAFGISTKLAPKTTADAFMSDNSLQENKDVIDSDIAAIKDDGRQIVFPKDGFGTGRAELKERAPQTYAYLKQRLQEEFGFNNDTGVVSKSTQQTDKEKEVNRQWTKDSEKAFNSDIVKAYTKVEVGPLKANRTLNEALSELDIFLEKTFGWSRVLTTYNKEKERFEFKADGIKFSVEGFTGGMKSGEFNIASFDVALNKIVDAKYNTQLGLGVVNETATQETNEIETIEDQMESDELDITSDDEFNIDDSIKKAKKKKGNNLFTALDVKQKSLKATQAQIEAAKEWYENSPISKYISFKQMFKTINSDAVAQWSADGIVLFNGSDYSDLYHEAFHGFSQTFLNKKQRKELYDEVRKKEGTFKDYKGQYATFKKATDKQIEEHLAEGFREYMLKGKKATKGSPKQNSFFRRIWNALKALFTGTTARDVATNNTSDKYIKELYEKLRVGNLHEYSYDVRNAQFGNLNSGIVSSKKQLDLFKPNELTVLNYQNSKTVIDMVDYFMSDYVDLMNSELSTDQRNERNALYDELHDPNIQMGIEERKEKEAKYKALKDKATYQWTSSVTNDKNVRAGALAFAKKRLNDLKNAKAKDYTSEKDATEKVRLRNDYYMLKFAVDNFGNLKDLDANDPIDGADVDTVIGYHKLKTKVFDTEFKIQDEQAQGDEAFIAATQGFTRNGNENSLKELAKGEIVYLLKTLPKFEKDKKTGKWEPKLNRFGIPELNDYQATWNRLARGLENSQDFDLMYKRLQGVADKYPPAQELINRMGNPYENMTSKNEHGLWTNFWQTFNKARVPLIQMMVEEDADLSTGELMRLAKIGEAFNADKAIQRRWQNQMAEAFPDPQTNYLLKDKEGNYLNMEAVLQDYPTAADASADAIGFYRAIGFDFTETDEIYEALSNDELKERYDPQYFHTDLVRLNNSTDDKGKPIIVRDLSQLTQGKSTRMKDLLALEAAYSDSGSNFMVTNAEGNTQFEHTLNNSMTMMVSSINNAETYQQLIDMPHMEDLNIETNPFAASSIWLQSIFDLDPTSPRFGEKRKYRGVPVTLKLTNLSGVIYQDITINEETGFIEKGIGQGVSSAAADEFSKLILDLHLNAAGIPELMRHADKGTSYSISISGRVIGNSNAKDNYIPMEDFSGSSYKLTAYERLMPQITAEISRSNTLISYNEMNNGKGIKNYDYNYIKKITDPEKGKFFYQFDAVLTPETKALLKKETAGLTSQVEILEKIKSLDLEKTIRKEMNDYFQKQFLEVQSKFNEARFVGSNTRQSMINAGIASHNVNDTFVRSAVYNSFIHNIESLNLIYGDLAQFNENKDGFHKRNAGAGSTGTILRTDKVMQNYINNSLWENSYAYAQGHTQHLYTGRAKTAIVENMDVDSIYKDDYAKAYAKESKKAAKKADKYDGQDEADAQGLISFDAYRQFKVAEGSWSDAHDALYDAIVSGNGDKINPAKVTKFFPVIKGQYWGRLNDSRGLLPVTGMHKYSLFPLIPTVIKNKKAQVLHEKMSQEGIAYVTFESGSKVGIMQKDKNSGLDKLFVDQVDRNLTEGLMTADGQVTPYDPNNPYFTPNVINLEFFKNQLEIHDESKGNVIFSTQLRKLIEDGLFKNGVPVDFASKGSKETRIKKWEALTEDQKEEASPYYVLAKVYESNVAALTEHAKEKLLEEIGWTSKKEADGTETLSGSMESLMKMVKAELTRQDLGDHSIDYIQIDADGNLKHDLSGSFFVEKLEKVLNALMVKRLVNQKVNGEGLIQVASTLFEDAGITERFRDATPEELKKYKGTNDLPNYIQGEGPNGETSACKVKVALRGDFVKLLNATHNDGKRIGTIERLNQMIQNDQWLNTGENRRMITMTGVRIPVQGMNSMEFMEVYEFLPAEAGSVIIPPTEIVTKSGADFDVDKMTVMMPNLAVINGKTEVIKKVDVTGLNKEEVRDKLQSLRDKRKALTDKWDNVFNEKDRKKRQAFFPFTDEQNQKLDEFAETVDPIWAQIKELLGEKKEIKKTYQNKKSTLFNKLNRANTKLENLYDQLEEVNKERQEYVKVFAKEAFENVVDEQKAEMENINTRIADTQRQLNGFTSKGIENALISNIAEILALPSNFIPLTTPNSTELLDESSNEMSEFATDYDPYSDGNFILDKNGNKKPVISPTKALEMGYNLDKHSKNAIGKDVLGIGAVDNTYNTLFNRVGVYLNPATVDIKAYNKALKKDSTKRTERENEIIDNYQRVTIRMPHNTRKVDGLKAIELSDIDAKDKNKVSDVVNQMINGWVDIAADPWIFNIQGNKEVGPTLLFLIQAGVPIKEAIYFVSNPIIREYVKQQKLYKSPLARAFGKEISNPSFAKNNAIREILTDERFGFNISDFDLQGRKFNSKIKELITQTAEGSNFDSNDLKTKAKSNINRAFDSVDREIFIHFLQLEKITGSVRDIKMRTNVDTTKDASLFAAVDRIDMLTALETDPIIPRGTAAKLKGENNDGYNSPISSFFIQQFQIDLLGDGFPLRNHNVLNQFIRENLDKAVIDDTYGNKDSAVINLKSDLVNYMFQNELRYFDINNVKDYLNYPVEEYEVADAMTDYGAVVKDGKIYIDKRVLKEQWEDQAFATVSYKLGVAKTSTDAFNNENEYYHFVIMRELFRDQNPIESLLDSGKFTSKLDYVSSILNIKEGESEKEYLERMLDATYEVYLRDEALHRTFNHYGLFESSATFADEFVRIRETYKPLVDEYPGLMNRMQMTSLKSGSTKNLALTTSELDADDINIMAENLYKLQDRTEVGNLLPDATAKEISEITQFFNDLEIYAFLQSGLNMKSSFALNQFVPQVKANGQPGKVLQILDEPMKKIVKEMDENSTAIGAYLDSFYRSWKAENKITNRALRVRGKNYSENKSVLNKESMFTGTSTPAAQKVLFEDQYKNLKELEQNGAVTNEVTTVSSAYGVVTANNEPDKARTKLNVDLIAPQIAAQAYKENNSATANDMFSYGLRWTRKGNAKEPISNHSSANKGLPTEDALAKDGYVYDTLDQNGNPLAPVSDLQPIIDELEATLGLDMSNYDAVLGNIYLPGQRISTHRDTTESISARNYPVVVYTIGNDSGINVYENVDKNNIATGKPSFASDRKTSIPTTNGSIYTFGMDGKGRFEMGHDTPAGIKRDKTFPPITLPNGDVITNYTITLTFRRAGDLTGNMRATPTQRTVPSQDKLTDRVYDPTPLTREEAAVLAHNNDNNIYVYNLATENAKANTNGDKTFHGAGPNVFGIPSIRSYRGDFLRYFNDNADGTIDSDLKDLIDKAIQGLVDKKGKNLIFSEKGYGREFIEKDPQGKYLAPQAFLYLSEQLFDKFGYVNPGYLTSSTQYGEIMDIIGLPQSYARDVMQETLFSKGKQTITDKQIQKDREEEISELSDSSVKEFMKHCNI